MAAAQGWFVTTTGSDSNPGTAASPFLTLNKAVAVASPSDFVFVAPGTYNGQWAINRGGSVSLGPVTFVSTTPGGALIRTTGVAGPCVSISANYVTLMGFDISGDSSASAGVVGTGKFAVVSRCTVHDLTAAGAQGIKFTSATLGDNDIYGCTVFSIGVGADTSAHGLYAGTARGHVWNNKVYKCSGRGINVTEYATAGVISHNLSFNNTGDGIAIGGTGGSTNDNTVVSNNIVRNNSGTGLLETGTTGSGNQYLNNCLYQNATAGITLLTGSQSGNLVSTNPLMVNYLNNGSGDYHLTASSPCIGAGTATGLVSPDLDYRCRPQYTAGGAQVFDIGPYVYQQAGLGYSDGPYGITYFVGGSWPNPFLGQQELDDLLGLYPGGGNWLRYQLRWSGIEYIPPVSGVPTYDWTILDDVVSRCNANRINVCFPVEICPTWYQAIANDGLAHTTTLSASLTHGVATTSLTLAALSPSVALADQSVLTLDYGGSHPESVTVNHSGGYASGYSGVVTIKNFTPAFDHASGATVVEGSLPNASDMTVFCQAVATRYNGSVNSPSTGVPMKIAAIQIGNEEWDTANRTGTPFGPVVAAAAPAIRAIYPACRIGICSVRKTPSNARTHIINWMTAVYNGSSNLANVDWVDFHYYRDGTQDENGNYVNDPTLPTYSSSTHTLANMNAPDVGQELSDIKSVIGPQIEVWCGETGWDVYHQNTDTYYTDTPSTVTQAQQRDYTWDMYEVMRKNGGAKVIAWTMVPFSVVSTKNFPTSPSDPTVVSNVPVANQPKGFTQTIGGVYTYQLVYSDPATGRGTKEYAALYPIWTIRDLPTRIRIQLASLRSLASRIRIQAAAGLRDLASRVRIASRLSHDLGVRVVISEIAIPPSIIHDLTDSIAQGISDYNATFAASTSPAGIASAAILSGVSGRSTTQTMGRLLLVADPQDRALFLAAGGRVVANLTSYFGAIRSLPIFSLAYAPLLDGLDQVFGDVGGLVDWVEIFTLRPGDQGVLSAFVVNAFNFYASLSVALGYRAAGLPTTPLPAVAAFPFATVDPLYSFTCGSDSSMRFGMAYQTAASFGGGQAPLFLYKTSLGNAVGGATFTITGQFADGSPVTLSYTTLPSQAGNSSLALGSVPLGLSAAAVTGVTGTGMTMGEQYSIGAKLVRPSAY